ncbi:MAG: hypothetical protein V3R79_09195, partial [Alphaproteobacteria bacterium]
GGARKNPLKRRRPGRGGDFAVRWLANKLYPKDAFAARRGALLADSILLVSAIVALVVLAVTLV